jgi:hypothetical protein
MSLITLFLAGNTGIGEVFMVSSTPDTGKTPPKAEVFVSRKN